ncbi:hypothetical protein Y1Q_0019354 [Alligator mississippiensis]|uniref:Uncharacterized protein n=1 Tax=Alligator mississippiensis TaxID=8496 RepID=A0A151MQX2_ALLMI|nr:hypothetical protein Y1Q_0019354 [Alligator mississippiensis]
MVAPQPAVEDVGEAALVVNDFLQDDGEVAFAVYEHPGALEWTEDGDVGAIHGPPASGKAYVVEAGDYFLWVGEVYKVVGQDILDDQADLLDSLSGHGFTHTNWLAM